MNSFFGDASLTLLLVSLGVILVWHWVVFPDPHDAPVPTFDEWSDCACALRGARVVERSAMRARCSDGAQVRSFDDAAFACRDASGDIEQARRALAELEAANDDFDSWVER